MLYGKICNENKEKEEIKQYTEDEHIVAYNFAVKQRLNALAENGNVEKLQTLNNMYKLFNVFNNHFERKPSAMMIAANNGNVTFVEKLWKISQPKLNNFNDIKIVEEKKNELDCDIKEDGHLEWDVVEKNLWYTSDEYNAALAVANEVVKNRQEQQEPEQEPEQEQEQEQEQQEQEPEQEEQEQEPEQEPEKQQQPVVPVVPVVPKQQKEPWIISKKDLTDQQIKEATDAIIDILVKILAETDFSKDNRYKFKDVETEIIKKIKDSEKVRVVWDGSSLNEVKLKKDVEIFVGKIKEAKFNKRIGCLKVWDWIAQLIKSLFKWDRKHHVTEIVNNCVKDKKNETKVFLVRKPDGPY